MNTNIVNECIYNIGGLDTIDTIGGLGGLGNVAKDAKDDKYYIPPTWRS